ncbi:hypothetical protein IWW48_001718 [Coemansia sp. RSA 1200]|nr:hypothetical protein IWW48_001718 [Coemansia sp. RSA 1200]
MEKNPDSHQPRFCTKGCGFYGDPLRNDMCSLCYSKSKPDVNQPTKATAAATTIEVKASAPASISVTCASGSGTPTVTASAAAAATAGADIASSSADATSTEPVGSQQHQIQVEHRAAESEIDTTIPAAAGISGSAPCITTVLPSSPHASSVASASPSIPSRKAPKKGRCFECNARVALVKQTTNRCRCDYVFCDSHRFPDQHECKFDFKESDRKGLEINNPKLNAKPRGGRSFTRID